MRRWNSKNTVVQETEEDKLAKRETAGRRETKRNVRLKLRKEVGTEEWLEGRYSTVASSVQSK